MAPTDVKFPLSTSGQIIPYNYSIAYSPMKGVDVLGDFINSCQKKQIRTGFYYTIASNNWFNVERGLVSEYFSIFFPSYALPCLTYSDSKPYITTRSS
jgi:hypothetical protein